MNNSSTVFSAKKLSMIFAKNKTLLFICLGIIAGFTLIILSVYTARSPSAKTPAPSGSYSQSDINEQVAYLEERLASIIGKLNGAGSVTVMITLDSSSEYQYAVKKSEKESSGSSSSGSRTVNSDNELILARDSDGGENPVLIKEIVPRVRGVAVVCAGTSKNEALRRDIISIISALFRISTARISVTA